MKTPSIPVDKARKAIMYSRMFFVIPQEAMMEIIVRNVVIMYSRREIPSNPT